MESFNEIFRWVIFKQMACALIFLCVVICIPLRYWKTMETLAIFQCISGSAFVIHGIMWKFVSMMGMVWEESSKFQCVIIGMLLKTSRNTTAKARNTLEAVYWMDDSSLALENLKLEVSSSSPFGFKGGRFFIYKSSTLLTMLYSVVTHIIIIFISLVQ